MGKLPDDKYYSGTKGIYLYPTEEQRILLDKYIEGTKIVYNWALYMEQNQYNLYLSGITDKSFLSFIDLVNMYKDFRITNPLLLELPTNTMRNAIKNVIKGYEMFFKHKDLYNKPKYKYNDGLFSSFHPRVDTFYFMDDIVYIEGIRPGIKTSFNTNYNRSDNIKYINPIIKRNNRTGEYSLSYVIAKDKLDNYFIENNIPKSEAIGIDVNKNIMYACSNGMMYEGVDTSRLEYHLSDINRNIQNDKNRLKEELLKNPEAKYSNNTIFRLEKRKRIYEKITNLNKDYAYKYSLDIVRRNPEAIILESLDIKKIMSYRFIADDLQFHPLGLYQRIIEEQAFKYNIPIIYAPDKFPSSNICSNCGFIIDIKSNKNFICPQCKLKINRDLNAAINLKKWYYNTR